MKKNKNVDNIVKVHYYNEDVETLFPKMMVEVNKAPSLVYLDQNGIKFLSDKYLLELEKAKQTDFLYFVSSSYFKRLGNTDEFKKNVQLNIDDLKNNPYKFIHRNVLDQLRKKIPKNSKLKLYPYSLKKGANIFGIVFGAKHPLAVDKFLDIAWHRNPVNGDANFDIDEDKPKNQLDLFGSKKLTKIEKFKNSLRAAVLVKQITNNFEALEFTHNQGHLSKHAFECLKDMKKNKEINFSSISPLVTYENVYKMRRKLEYQIL